MPLNLILSVLLSSFIFWILKLNKTSYILGYSMFVFVLSFIYFLHIGFEFIALIFMITYIGGIAVMFLFLILVLGLCVLSLKQKNSIQIIVFSILKIKC